jgi:hypothetical protein
MRQRIQPGALLSRGDPLCYLNTNEQFDSSTGHEVFNTDAGTWFETRREKILYSHCENLNPKVPQNDDPEVNKELIRSDKGPEHGGPMTSDRKL